MLTGLCPHCGHVDRWEFTTYSISYPPTEGDYEWAETDAQTTCPHCAANIEARIRVDLDDHTVSQLVSSPFPVLEDWHCYVVGYVRVWGDTTHNVSDANSPSHLCYNSI